MTALCGPSGTPFPFYLEAGLEVVTVNANHHADGIQVFVIKANTALLLCRGHGHIRTRTLSHNMASISLVETAMASRKGLTTAVTC